MHETNVSLTDLLCKPNLIFAIPAAHQNTLLRMAKQIGLLGFIAKNVNWEKRTGATADILEGAAKHVDYHVKMLDWEVHCLSTIFSDFPEKVILLKGAAYRMMKLDFSKGRFASDIDILVSKRMLDMAEERLLKMGWEFMTADDYEQHYYREWMHELPPLRHKERGTIIDLHHNILPETSKYRVDSEMLISAAIPSEQGFYTLSPEDTVLHKAVHLFVEGDLKYGLKELIDLHMLFNQLGQKPGFWENLLTRSKQLGFQRPLFYALYFCRRFFKLKLQPYIWKDISNFAPNAPIKKITLSLMERSFLPDDLDHPRFITKRAQNLTYLRSHLLRMPLFLLIKHLSRQAWHRGGIKTGTPKS